jgi:hypothetical protein
MTLPFARLLEDASRDFDHVSRVRLDDGRLVIVVVAKQVVADGGPWEAVAERKIRAGAIDDGPYGLEVRVELSDLPSPA